MLAGAARLASFEDAVASIVRIEVPAGVLADVPADAEDAEATGEPAEDGDDPAAKPLSPRNILLIGTDSAVGLDADDPAGQSPAGQRLETRSRHCPKGTRDTSDDPDPPDRRAANSTPTTLTS